MPDSKQKCQQRIIAKRKDRSGIIANAVFYLDFYVSQAVENEYTINFLVTQSLDLMPAMWQISAVEGQNPVYGVYSFTHSSGKH